MSEITQAITVPSREQVDEKAQAIFDQLAKSMGRVPNLFALIGHSSNALESSLAFGSAQAKGTFSLKEREAIYLAVSQANGCDYCLAAHTAVAKMNGFSDDDTLKLRTGTIEDRKLNVLTRLAGALVDGRGQVDAGLLDEFYGLGYNEGALIDLVALVADKTFTNYLGRLTGVEVDFPAAPALR